MTKQNDVMKLVIAMLLVFNISFTASGLEIGVDISEIKVAEQNGVQFRDTDWTEKPAIQIFKDHGFTWARIRILVEADGNYALNQNLDYVKSLALEAKNHGFKFLLDFYYSNWWTDPENQWTPDSWRNKSLNELCSLLYNYTYDIIVALRNQNTMPDMIQIGNKVDKGMLRDWGSNFNWNNFVWLTNSGVNAVNDAKAMYEMPKIMMHIDKGGDQKASQRWLENFINKGGWIDALGLSYFPMQQGSMENLMDNVQNIKSQFPWLDVYIVETAYYWDTNEAGYSELAFPQTPQGQKDYLRTLRDKAQQAGISGIFYWGAGWSQSWKWLYAPGWSNDDQSRRSLFDDNAVATKGIEGLAW